MCVLNIFFSNRNKWGHAFFFVHMVCATTLPGTLCRLWYKIFCCLGAKTSFFLVRYASRSISGMVARNHDTARGCCECVSEGASKVGYSALE